MRLKQNDTASYVIAEANGDIEMRSRPERWLVSSSTKSTMLCSSACPWKRYLAADLAAAFKHVALNADCSFGRHEGDRGLLFEYDNGVCLEIFKKKAVSSQAPGSPGMSRFGSIYAVLQMLRTCPHSNRRPIFVTIQPEARHSQLQRSFCITRVRHRRALAAFDSRKEDSSRTCYVRVIPLLSFARPISPGTSGVSSDKARAGGINCPPEKSGLSR